MQYDIVAKRLLEMGKLVILDKFFGIEAHSAELIEKLPKEVVSTRSTDFALLVNDKTPASPSKIVILEIQTRWDPQKPRTLADYRIRFQKKYPGLEVIPCMLLLTPHAKALDIYQDNYLTFKFHLVRIWQLDALKFKNTGLELLPLVPLMENGLECVIELEEQIYNSNLNRAEKSELLTALTILVGLKDKNIVTLLLNRRRDIMIESPAYDMIKEAIKEDAKQKGIKEGEHKNQLKIAKNMLEDNTELASVLKWTGLTEVELREAGLIK